MAHFSDLFDISLEEAAELETVFRDVIARGCVRSPDQQSEAEEAVLRAFRLVPVGADGRLDRSLIVGTVLAELEAREIISARRARTL